MNKDRTSVTPLAILRRYQRKLPVVFMLGILALALVSFKPFRPNCGLPDYTFGSELSVDFFQEFLLQMHFLRDREGYSWTGVFLIKDERLYLLPWERDTALTAEATRLAALSIIDQWFHRLADSERLTTRQHFNRAAAIASGAEGDESLGHVWCENLLDMATLEID